MNTLLLRLAGPMQSWGSRSRFDNRDTGLEPTRSAVVGLLCAALGWGREADLMPFEALRMGVRVDRPGQVMVDFHTALDVIKADASGRDTVTSSRYYLADARFLVGLEGELDDWLRTLNNALKNPVWPLFLGRKSCPPAVPIAFPGDTGLVSLPLENALRQTSWLLPGEAPLKTLPKTIRCVMEVTAREGTASADWPLSFAQRRFGLRHTISLEVPYPHPQE